MEKISYRTSIRFLSVYAAILAFQHGLFQLLQGNVRPSGVFIHAIGSPCQPEMVWHACFPALTIVPDYLISGILAMAVSITLIVWSVKLRDAKHSGWIMILLSLTLLLVGGGFVPTFIGIAGGIGLITRNTYLLKKQPFHRRIGKIWPWLILLMVAWLPGSWIMGHYFARAMLDLSFGLFLFFDLALPVMVVISTRASCYQAEHQV